MSLENDCPLFKNYHPDELLGLEDLKKMFKVGKDTIYLLQNSKLLPYLKLGDRKVRRRVAEEFILRWEGKEEDVLEIAKARLKKNDGEKEEKVARNE